ncbi:hypothetical protein HaLaN_04334 [Haematococcus lacustris]|uniref:Uncharacterized protein n=1 Tax=Haematococcus lacustris TaxID=44745 RepID=A0A699YGA6_HAELA|nr:hypothetical protein HaLaN_04334 [Haematococcus lacustris]
MDGVHVNNINLEKLKDRCFALMELLLHLRESGAFISTSRSSSELPKRSQDLTRIMCRVHSLLERQVFSTCILPNVQEVKAYCNAYSREGMMAAAGRFLLQSKHKEKYDELIAELRDLTVSENPRLCCNCYLLSCGCGCNGTRCGL